MATELERHSHHQVDYIAMFNEGPVDEAKYIAAACDRVKQLYLPRLPPAAPVVVHVVKVC